MWKKCDDLNGARMTACLVTCDMFTQGGGENKTDVIRRGEIRTIEGKLRVVIAESPGGQYRYGEPKTYYLPKQANEDYEVANFLATELCDLLVNIEKERAVKCRDVDAEHIAQGDYIDDYLINGEDMDAVFAVAKQVVDARVRAAPVVHGAVTGRFPAETRNPKTA